MIFSRLTLLLSLFLCSGVMAVAQQDTVENEASQTLFQYLQEVGIQEMLLEYEIDSLVANKFTANVYPGQVSFTVDTGTLSLPVELSVRGKFRRKECDSPPLKLEFKKKHLKRLGLKKADSYKLVTHCIDSKLGPQYLFKEYSAYKMYNLITDSSFQVQLFPITYINSRTKNRHSTHAMLIESNEEIEDRLGGKFDDDFGSTVDSVEAYTLEMTSLFNYMIGNQDMNLATCHNVKLLKIKGQRPKLTIPYDFDFSLYVNARYAFPRVDDNRNIKRKYHGAKQNKTNLDQVFKRFLDLEDDFKTTIRSVELLKNSQRGECLRYIQDFFYRIRSADYTMEYEP